MRSIALALVLLWSLPAWAQSDADRATARALGERAHVALAAKDYVTAADLFARAEALVAAPTLTLGLARAQVGLGKLVASHESYQRVVRWDLGARPPKAFSAAVEAARNELGALARRLASIVIQPVGAQGATVTIDGEVVPAAALGVPRVVDPGRHVLLARAAGFLPRRLEVELQEGGIRSVVLDLERAPAGVAPALTGSTAPGRVALARGPASSAPTIAITSTARPADPARPAAPWASTGRVLLGAGIAGLAAGVATGAAAMSVRPDAAATPNETDAYRRMRNLSIGSLAAGGAMLAGGLAFELAADQPARASRRRTGLALLGSGIAGVAVGAAAGGMNLGVNAHLRSSCPDHVCPGAERPNAESARHLGLVSIASFGAAAASLGTGAILVFSGGDSGTQTAGSPLSIEVASSGLRLRGTW